MIDQDAKRRFEEAKRILAENPKPVKDAFKRAKRKAGGNPTLFAKILSGELDFPINDVLTIILRGGY